MIDYVAQLDKRGIDTDKTSGEDNILISCPFHNDETPSMGVNIRNGLFYCFGCEEQGNFAKLIAELDGISYHDAKRILLDLDTPELVLRELEDILEEEEEPELKYFSEASFNKVFRKATTSVRAKRYLIGRGISETTADAFNLRWGGSESFVWRYRVIIPIYTYDGKLTNYSGRAVYPKTKPKIRKARPSRNTLFGAWTLANGIKVGDRYRYVILVEGEFDAMFLNQHGYHAVAVTGTVELTDVQISILRRMAAEVVIAYDNDIEKEDGTNPGSAWATSPGGDRSSSGRRPRR